MPTIKKLLKKTDSLRGKTTRNLLNALNFPPKKNQYEPIAAEDIKKILVCRPNHRLGNQLLITPLIQEINRTFPDAKIDLFLKGTAGKMIFENYHAVDRLLMLPRQHFRQFYRYMYCWISLKSRTYDLAINANSGSSSGRLATGFARAKHYFQGEETAHSADFPDDYHHFAKKSIYQLRRFLEKSGIPDTKEEIPPLDIKLKENEKTNGKNLLKQITKNEKPVIGIYTHATLNKCFSKDFWKPFYQSLEENYSEKYQIMEILPIENISQIDFASPNFYSKNIRELASMISAMEIFISADCGMMHLASATKIPVIGLFKFDTMETYKPYANKSVGVPPEHLNTGYISKQIDNIIQ